jgi:phage shock protein PspC (stress-responsive transcriptional regulator)
MFTRPDDAQTSGRQDSSRQDPGRQDSGRQDSAGPERTLRRAVRGRIVAGVASGIARYFGIDVAFVRIAFAVLTIVGFIGLPFLGWLPLYLLGIPLYLAGWLFIPEEGSDQSIAGTMLHRLQSRSH